MSQGDPRDPRRGPPPPFGQPARPIAPGSGIPPGPPPAGPAPVQPAAPPQPPPQPGAYPQQGASPQQGAYPQQPQQGAYPPQPQPGAYPQQGAYPPQPPHGAYPQQGAYPPQPPHGAYPQQGAYPPQPQHGAYPQQGAYPPQPQHGAYPQPPYPPPPQPGAYPPQPYPQPPHGAYPPPPYGQAPAAPRPPRPPGHGFFPFLRLSLLRAVRLRIEPEEVLPAERAALERAGVTEPSFQAFLAWRRSILFAVATLLVPLIALKAYEIYGEDSALPDSIAGTFRTLQTIPLLAEVMFCGLAWWQLSAWTHWRRQRRRLAWGWLVFFLAPFVVYLYPLRSLTGELIEGASPEQTRALSLLLGIGFSLQAMMTLAPKAVSLIPGMVRAATVTKLLFPGSAAPGWLIVLGAPIYALFVYVVLIVPYQLTGSGYFAVAILGIIGAEFLLGRGGYQLARPLTRAEAIAGVRRARLMYLAALVVAALFMLLALGELVEQLEWKLITVVNLAGTFLTNVWILTLITTDLLIAGLDRARGLSAGTTQLADDFDRQLATFIGQRTVAMAAVAPPPDVEPPP